MGLVQRLEALFRDLPFRGELTSLSQVKYGAVRFVRENSDEVALEMTMNSKDGVTSIEVQTKEEYQRRIYDDGGLQAAQRIRYEGEYLEEYTLRVEQDSTQPGIKLIQPADPQYLTELKRLRRGQPQYVPSNKYTPGEVERRVKSFFDDFDALA